MNSDYYINKFKSIAGKKVWVAIDAANLEQSVRDMFVHPKDTTEQYKGVAPDNLKWGVDYRALKDFFDSITKVVTINFYTARFETESHDKFLTFMKKHGYHLITKNLKPYHDHTPDHPHRKANFDVELTVDAMHYLNSYDTIVLFSGDSDFEYLAKFLGKHNKKVILFSRKGHVAKELFPVSHAYFDIVDFRYNFLRIQIMPLNKPKIPLRGLGGL